MDFAKDSSSGMTERGDRGGGGGDRRPVSGCNSVFAVVPGSSGLLYRFGIVR